ncbi:MAG TPA: restriction endonuclease subunit S [Vicinamibacterales bacterium]|nr:restriction endonuclease subunit S [Vicinamibacterales bacterium]
MNQTRLLKHFDLISGAPDAVPRLRQFILELAVRGRLAEQDPSEGSAFELLGQIQQEKARLVKAGTIRSRKVVEANVRAEDELYPLPAGWMWCRLSDVGAIVGGGTPPSDDASNFTTSGSGTAWLTPADLGRQQEEYVSHGARDLTPVGLASSSATMMPKGSVLFTSRAPIGYTAIAANELSTNQGFKSVVPFVMSCNRYVAVYFRAFGRRIEEMASGTTFREVSGRIVSALPFPLPPLAEQQRIVAKVDELMALCDRLEAAQAERERRRDRLAASSLSRLNQPANDHSFRDDAGFYLAQFPRLTLRAEHIGALRETIVNFAVRGKLVRQDVRDECTRELLARSKTEREQLVKQGALKRVAPPNWVGIDEAPFEPPAGWAWVTIGDLLLGDSQNGYSKKPDGAADGVPVLRISAGTTRRDGMVAEEEHKRSGGISSELRAHYGLLPGDLLACRFNGNRSFVGRLSLYTGYLGLDPIYPDKLIRLRLLSQFFLPKLVVYFAQSSVVRRDIEDYCATTVGNWGISASNLKNVKIPIPPLAEQHRIVARLDELMASCDRLETLVTTARTDERGLLDTVLHEALAVGA